MILQVRLGISRNTFVKMRPTLHPPLWLTGAVTHALPSNVVTYCSGIGDSTGSASGVVPATMMFISDDLADVTEAPRDALLRYSCNARATGEI